MPIAKPQWLKHAFGQFLLMLYKLLFIILKMSNLHSRHRDLTHQPLGT